ncbi:MAG: cupin domain-containing protein [Candidatus Rokubacteria bacterium]|nr:cupin domain-containing protein [Candidatus Rokubacteria bacterium]
MISETKTFVTGSCQTEGLCPPRHSEHTAPFDALVHVLDGEVAITISGNPFHLRTGDAIVMPADEPHAVKAVKKFKMLLTMIRRG